jgi:hypothetical protein
LDTPRRRAYAIARCIRTIYSSRMGPGAAYLKLI